MPRKLSAPNVMPLSGDRPTFTVEQANRTLPLVQRIVADIVADHRTWQDTAREYERAVNASRGNPDPRVDALQRTARRLNADIQRYLGELASLGIECKSLEEGLIDFPGVVEGEPALLCWKLGEPEVAWWHPTDAGFAGRRPLSPNAATEVVP